MCTADQNKNNSQLVQNTQMNKESVIKLLIGETMDLYKKVEMSTTKFWIWFLVLFIWFQYIQWIEQISIKHKTFDLLQIYFNICPWVKISPKILFSFQKSSHYEWGGLQNYFPVGYRRTFIVFHQFHWTDWQFLVGGQKFKTACPESVSSFTACPCNIWYSKSFLKL